MSSSVQGIFIRNYKDYLEKKRSAASFCKNPPKACFELGQGQYLLYKTYQVPCYYSQPLVCNVKNFNSGSSLNASSSCILNSCEELNMMYDGITYNEIM